MINLLPPGIKANTGYAKRNSILLRYVWLLIITALVLGLEFGATEYYIAKQNHTYNQQIAAKQQAIDGYKQIQDQATVANTRLSAFKQLVGQQTNFSSLLTDLANHTPKGVFINSITLTGVTTQAVQISASANSYESAVSLRDALATSPRIKAASINDISNSAVGVYNIDVTIAFSAGAFK